MTRTTTLFALPLLAALLALPAGASHGKWHGPHGGGKPADAGPPGKAPAGKGPSGEKGRGKGKDNGPPHG